MRILVLGTSGMLGNAVFRFFAEVPEYDVYGSARTSAAAPPLPKHGKSMIIAGIDATDIDGLTKVFDDVRPSLVINCIGLVKQQKEASDAILALTVNALFPHQLARLCGQVGARLIHVSTDCVFAGTRGMYREEDAPDAQDLYGRSKLLGEVDYPHAITLRTSIIGHELQGAQSLVGWFLAQEKSVKGYTAAIFSGLPTVELAHVMRDHVMPRPDLRGLYHVASSPISKYDLLQLVAKEYGKAIDIVPDGTLAIDRSLDARRFNAATGYVPPSWPELVAKMRHFG